MMEPHAKSTPPSIAETVDEAAQQSLSKFGKVRTALEAVMVNSLHRIDQSERDAVNRYREKQVFGGDGKPASGAGQAEGDVIVCDDMHISLPQSPPPAQPGYSLGPLGVVGVALVSSMLPVLALWLAGRGQSPAMPSMPAIADSEYEVRFYDREGRPIQVPHIKTRPTEPGK